MNIKSLYLNYKSKENKVKGARGEEQKSISIKGGKRMKRLVAVLLCMTMAVSITACGNSETENNKVAGTEAGDKPESISVICSTDEEGLYEYAGKKYEEMYGVKVNLICQSYDSTHEKITTTWTGGGDADVCYVDIPWVAEFESKGVTIDLSEYMDEDVKNSFTVSSFKSEMKGIYSSCIGKETLDEAPFAYRRIDEIAEVIGDSVNIEKIIRPVYNFKAGGER